MTRKKKITLNLPLLLGIVVLLLVSLGVPKLMAIYDARGYVFIKEWNVRFVLPPELYGDIHYRITPLEDGGDEGARATFYSKRLDVYEPACAYYKYLGTGVSMDRWPGADEDFPSGVTSVYEDGYLARGDLAAIDGYHYSISTSYGYPNDLCHKHTADESDPIWPKAKKVRDALHKAVLTLERVD